MTIFEFDDYKTYFNSWVQGLPKQGRGAYRKVAEKLNVSTTMISQVFNGDKHLNLELASELGDYLNLNETETEYLFLLIEFARAGTFKLKQKLKVRLKKAQDEAKKLENRLKKDRELTDDTKSLFYSNYLYTAVFNLVALPQMNDAVAISERLRVPMPMVQKILDFLIKENLVLQNAGKLDVGPRRTHLGADSPHVNRHHQNWRIQGFQRMNLTNPENLYYTGPMSLSKEVAEIIRQEIPAFIEKLNRLIIPSDSEVTKCLNIDWFEF